MKRTLFSLIELLFPIRTDTKIVQRIGPDELIKIIAKINDKDIISLLPFSDFRIRACIHELKFHDNPKALKLIAGVLHTYLLNKNLSTTIIPIPLSAKRKHKRGYNQVERIAKVAVVGTTCTLETGVLYRHKDTQPQTLLKMSEREDNVKDAFSVMQNDYSNRKILHQHIILLDDVTTTGATLRAAKATLLPLCPASITCMAIAH